jgi:hypothetical protein
VVINELLGRLARELQSCDEESFASAVRVAIAGTPEERTAFLMSNNLWGGPVSIADQAGTRGERSEGRRLIEVALRDLGHEQLRVGIVNSRTQMWVDVFEKWAARGI